MELTENAAVQPKALLVAVDTGDYDAQASMAELYELVRSADVEPFGSMTQKRPARDRATCVGSGMLKEITAFCQSNELDLLVFDCELSPSQLRNIEEISRLRVIDRTMLILDIFAARAMSSEGKLQVELAQLRYLLPRLMGKGTALSRLGGGIGTRGPGESKLETDRRHIRRRIDSLNEQLIEVEKHRAQLQRRRDKDEVISVALVGYTNAGKSTLMNALTEAGVLVKDMLFATLDPTARALKLPGGQTVMLVDTVGLLRRLPHQLIQAFRSTLEQAANADVLLNVCDASSREAQIHLEVTRELLTDMGCAGHPIIPVMNKCDLVPALADMPMIGGAVRISAKTGEGIPALLEAIERSLPERQVLRSVLLPFANSGLAAKVRKDGAVLQEDYTEEGLRLTVRVGPALLSLLEPFLVP